MSEDAETTEEAITATPWKALERAEKQPRTCPVLYSSESLLNKHASVQDLSLGSSHSSAPATMLSPHIVLHLDGSPEHFQPSSIQHVFEHPSLLSSLKSSHPSSPLISPSAQTGVHLEGDCLQTNPCSTWQVLEHPSLETVFESSQFSPGPTDPFPQTSIQMHCWFTKENDNAHWVQIPMFKVQL